MMEEKEYDKWEQYGNSKLANILFTKELANQLKGENAAQLYYHSATVVLIRCI